MVIPVLRRHKDRCRQETNYGSGNSSCFGVRLLFYKVANCQYPQSDPDSKGVERACKCVITFSRLQGILVEVQYDSNTCKKEQQTDNPGIFLIVFKMPEGS